MHLKKTVILFVLVLRTILLYPIGEQKKIDSLQTLLKKSDLIDSLKEKLLYKLFIEYMDAGQVDSAIVISTNYLNEVTKANNIQKMVEWGVSKGTAYINKGYFDEAINNFLFAKKWSEKLTPPLLGASIANNLGLCYQSKGDYDKALQYYITSLNLYENLNDNNGVALLYNNMGNVYYRKKDYQGALKFYFKALSANKTTGNKLRKSYCYHNIGAVYEAFNDYNKALEYLFKSLELKKELGDKNQIGETYNNIGSNYEKLHDYSHALMYYNKSLKIAEEIKNELQLTSSHSSLGDLYEKLSDNPKALYHLNLALEMGKKIGAKEYVKDIYSVFSKLYVKTRDYKKAYDYNTLYIEMKDSLLNEQSIGQIAEMNAKYESEKKDKEIKLLTKDNEVREAEISKQRVIKNSILLGLVLVLLFAFALLNRFYITRKQKKIIEFQKQEVEEQKIIIEEKNKNITDSINYAQGIQKAILPHRRDIWAAFPNSFVFYKPKDIVSGDFYFFSSVSDFVHLIAVVDCTGHGIPGGFMTMLCSEKLTAATQQTQSPDEILSVLNKGVKQALKQSHESDSSKDGMDIALCLIDTLNKTVKYSGANRPLWILKKDTSEIHEIKATKKAIAGFTEDDQKFELHSIPLQEGDSIFLSTDGYADLFNVKGKKIGSKQFKLQLAEIQKMPLKQQGTFLEKYADQWAARVEQTDDILVIGLRL